MPKIKEENRKRKRRPPSSNETKKKISESLKGRIFSQEHKDKIGAASKKNNNIAFVQTPETYQKISEANKGKIPWHAGKKMGPEWGERMRLINTGKRLGAEHHFWKGGIAKVNADERRQVYSTAEYQAFRRGVLLRDNKTCQHKDENCEGTLHVDHIKPWCLYPELRLDINNGRVLCAYHHKQTDTYGGKTFKYLKADL